MNDTHPGVDAKMNELLRARTPEERLLMGASMFDTAKAMVLAGIRRDRPDLGEPGVRRALFLRFYADDFDPPRREQIAEWIASGRSPDR
jgi:hypothetical protein